MARYVLFAHPPRESNGGWHDFLHSFSSPPTDEEVHEKVVSKYGTKTNVLFHVIDLQGFKTISDGAVIGDRQCFEHNLL